MRNIKFGSILLAIIVCGMAQAGSYTAASVSTRDSSPAYKPTKAVPYEDSYHIAGVSWSNDRAIASESADREPSSVEPVIKEEPKPWLIKTEANQPY